MIGIYKITNKDNGKVYIGQSNDIERRFKEHKIKCSTSERCIDYAIKKYGVKAFEYDILEECSLEELNEREIYWIKFYDSKNNGYNLTDGGENAAGENNGNAKVTEEDVLIIRQAYNNHLNQKEIYENFKDKITFNNFQAIWQGVTWQHVMPEVFTKENKDYYKYQTSVGENSKCAKLTNEEVLLCRQRYVNENARAIYQGFEDRIKYQSFQDMLWGRTYKNVPIYKKKEKKWINI